MTTNSSTPKMAIKTYTSYMQDWLLVLEGPTWIFSWIGTSLHGQLWIFSRRRLHRRIGSWFGIPRWTLCVLSSNPSGCGTWWLHEKSFMNLRTSLWSSFGSCSWTMVHLYWEPISWTSFMAPLSSGLRTWAAEGFFVGRSASTKTLVMLPGSHHPPIWRILKSHLDNSLRPSHYWGNSAANSWVLFVDSWEARAEHMFFVVWGFWVIW